MITLSGLQLVAACPGVVTLPRRQRTGRAPVLGTAIHKLIQEKIEGTADEWRPRPFLDELSLDDAGRLGFLAENMRLPVPPSALCEVPLGYWPDGSVRRVDGGAGVYTDEGQILSGTVDAMWSEPVPLGVMGAGGHEAVTIAPGAQALWVVDWKTGDDEHVPPVDRNLQLRAGAVLAARWTGARRVIPALCFVNAAECAAAVRESRVYTGRWEVGAPLDAAALDGIERDMRAVLARARGEASDGRGAEDQTDHRGGLAGHRVSSRGPGSGTGRGAHHHVDGGRDLEAPGESPVSDAAGSRSGSRAPLILGPHCEHCPARGSCPALAAEALTLARAEGLYIPPGGALTRDAAARLVGMLGPARRVLEAVEVAVRAHVREHGPLRLPSGQEYGPELEQTTRFVTGPTFDALSAVVGEERAQGAFEATGASLKRALDGEPRGAWRRLREDIEARDGVVTGTREVWRLRYPAKPVEVSDGVRDAGTSGAGRSGGGRLGGDGFDPNLGCRQGRDVVDGRGKVQRGTDPGHALHDAGGSAAEGAGQAQDVTEVTDARRMGDLDGDRGQTGLLDRDPIERGEAGSVVDHRQGRSDDAPGESVDVGGHRESAGVDEHASGSAGDGRTVASLLTRAVCPVCHVEHALTKWGVHRKHLTPGSGSRCAGSGRSA